VRSAALTKTPVAYLIENRCNLGDLRDDKTPILEWVRLILSMHLSNWILDKITLQNSLTERVL